MSEKPSQPGAESPIATDKAPTRQQVFLRRSASTVTLWAILAAVFVFPHRALFGGLAGLLLVAALFEYFRIAFAEDLAAGNRRAYRLTAVPTILVAVIYLIGLFGWLKLGPSFDARLEGFAIAAVVILLVVVRLGAAVEAERTFREMAVGVFGFVYLGVLFGFVIRIFTMPELVAGGKAVGHLYLLYLLAITKFTDMGAYIVGSMIGRHKMIPHISPGKTWEGIAGGLCFAALAALGLKALMPETLALVSWPAAFGLAVVLAALAVVGDLAESILKRSLAVKDSGHVMPGIGGVLDLVDSILFTAPAFYLYLLIVTG